jgi:hypothetical protein
LTDATELPCHDLASQDFSDFQQDGPHVAIICNWYSNIEQIGHCFNLNKIGWFTFILHTNKNITGMNDNYITSLMPWNYLTFFG